MNVAYVRVSTKEQNEARQVTALEKYDIDKWFTEKISGKNTDREQLQTMLDFVREGDTIYVKSYSRIARSTLDLLALVKDLAKRGINFVSVAENIDTSTPQGRLFLTIMAGLSQFEREIMLERQREGIEEAQKAGKFKGKAYMLFNKKKFIALYNDVLDEKITKKYMYTTLGCSRNKLRDSIAYYENGMYEKIFKEDGVK